MPTHGDEDSVKEDNVTDKTERDNKGVLLVETGRGEGVNVETERTTARDVGVITNVDPSVERGRDERRLKSSVTDDSVAVGGR
jgi:hypothetical protein